MPLDLGIADASETGRLPARLVVLVDDHRSYPFIEILSLDDTRHDTEFGAHASREVPGLAATNLGERDLETERRFGADDGGGFPGPGRVGALGIRLAVERVEDGLDVRARKQPVDGSAPCRDRPLPRW